MLWLKYYKVSSWRAFVLWLKYYKVSTAGERLCFGPTSRISLWCLAALGSRPAALPLPWGAGSASFSRVSRPSVLRTVMESTARSCCTSPY